MYGKKEVEKGGKEGSGKTKNETGNEFIGINGGGFDFGLSVKKVFNTWGHIEFWKNSNSG